MKNIYIYIIMTFILSGLASAGVDIQQQDLDLSGRLAIVSGTVYDAETGEPVGAGYPVRIFCDHEGSIIQFDFDDLVTSDQGMYSAWTMNLFSTDCTAGDDAWVEVDYNEETFTSEKVTLVSNGAIDVAGVDASVGVPEYGTMTLAMAVVFVGLGLVLLRRKI